MSKFCGFSNKVDSDIFAAETNIVIFRFQQETRKEHHCESGTAICQFIKITLPDHYYFLFWSRILCQRKKCAL